MIKVEIEESSNRKTWHQMEVNDSFIDGEGDLVIKLSDDEYIYWNGHRFIKEDIENREDNDWCNILREMVNIEMKVTRGKLYD